jgi:hypothetical protein
MPDPDDDASRWTLVQGEGPLLATAIHAGHGVRSEVAPLFALGEEERRREEDPYTDHWTDVVANQLVVHHSRFEVDLNRARATAVYLRPEDSWHLQVWKEPPAAEVIERSLAFHDRFYAEVRSLLGDLERRHGRFVVLDLHSYNHRRDGPTAEAADRDVNPEVNIGTISMDRARWAPVVDGFMEALRAVDYRGRQLDVRENVRFQGRGELARFVHTHFPESGCCLAIELKKFFMDEWTGGPDWGEIRSIRAALAATVPTLEDRLAAI